jgi:hypothetical protein
VLLDDRGMEPRQDMLPHPSFLGVKENLALFGMVS